LRRAAGLAELAAHTAGGRVAAFSVHSPVSIATLGLGAIDVSQAEMMTVVRRSGAK